MEADADSESGSALQCMRIHITGANATSVKPLVGASGELFPGQAGQQDILSILASSKLTLSGSPVYIHKLTLTTSSVVEPEPAGTSQTF